MEEEKKNTIVAMIIIASIIVVTTVLIIMILTEKKEEHNDTEENITNNLQQQTNNNGITNEPEKIPVEVESQELSEAINFINTLPMHLNFMNTSFNSVEELTNEQKIQLVLAYAYKNDKWKEIQNGESIEYQINPDDLKTEDIFGENISFTNQGVNVYIDSNTEKNIIYKNGVYTFSLKLKNDIVNNYSRVYRTKVENDVYYIYLKQGYIMQTINGKTDIIDVKPTDTIEYSLKQYTDNSTIFSYKNEASQVYETYNFEDALRNNYTSFSNKMKTYEYALKKDAKGNFYLSGFKIN